MSDVKEWMKSKTSAISVGRKNYCNSPHGSFIVTTV